MTLKDPNGLDIEQGDIVLLPCKVIFVHAGYLQVNVAVKSGAPHDLSPAMPYLMPEQVVKFPFELKDLFRPFYVSRASESATNDHGSDGSGAD